MSSERKSAVTMQKIERGRQQRKKLPPPSKGPLPPPSILPPPSSKLPPPPSKLPPPPKLPPPRPSSSPTHHHHGKHEHAAVPTAANDADAVAVADADADADANADEINTSANITSLGKAWIYEDPLFELPEEVAVECNGDGFTFCATDRMKEVKSFRWPEITGHDAFTDDLDPGACEFFTFWAGDLKYVLEVEAVKPFVQAFTRDFGEWARVESI
jgi:hypothetical protein